MLDSSHMYTFRHTQQYNFLKSYRVSSPKNKVNTRRHPIGSKNTKGILHEYDTRNEEAFERFSVTTCCLHDNHDFILWYTYGQFIISNWANQS